MRKKSTSYTFFHQYTSAILIFLLFISQTIHVSFFDRAEAGTTDYRDIVSIIVDSATYSSLKGKINRYAEDIQSYQKDTRTVIIITPSDTPPHAIAAKNEKLYYEGDGDAGVSRLVGTVIIGNILVPVVHKDDISFPSLYPYVDFDDKSFIYNFRSDIYEYSPDAPTNTEVDIWHGVMNPALGREWEGNSDTQKIGLLLDKTHDFYTKQGKFVPSVSPPRVFYYDGYAESKSVDAKSFYKYVLFLQNVENLAYRRFTKYLLSDISSALRQYNQASRGSEDDYLNTIPGFESLTLGDDTLDPSTISSLPDIQTARPIGKYLLKFHEILNQKTLGDIQKFVHNAGRYNSGTMVRVDQGAIQMSLMDEVSLRTIKEANDGLEKTIDQAIEKNNYARKVILFDRLERTQTGYINKSDTFVPFADKTLYYNKVYSGYFFGEKTANITSSNQCTIARGNLGQIGSFGRSVLVEANVGYDVKVVEGHVDTLSGDTQELVRTYGPTYACFTSAGAKIQSYWGGNSILRVAADPNSINSLFNDPPSGTSLSGFSLPIFSLGGMKETTRLSPPSLHDCLAGNIHEYALLQPYSYMEQGIDEWTRDQKVQWPKQLGRFTCVTDHQSLQDPIRSFSGSIEDYEKTPCFQGVLVLDKKYFDGTKFTDTKAPIGNSCKKLIGGGEGGSEEDTTFYEDRYYHSVPSLMKHVSPTDQEINAALDNGATPSLAVDEVRSVEFLTPKGNIAKFTYPNLFNAPGTDITSVRAWIKELSQREWNTVLTKENNTILGQYDIAVNNLIGAGTLPSSPIDWNSLISDDLISQVLRARNWLNPNVTKKYQNLIETNLSYSHEYGKNDIKNPPLIPRSGSGYEIAYLGLTPFIPKGDNSSETDDISDYTNKMAELEGLNFSENEPGDENPNNAESAKCGPPEGVSLFKWPQAIVCWIKTLLPPKIIAGSCGAGTIGLPNTISATSGSSLPPLAGDCTSIEFHPISNTIIAGSTSVGVLRLLDSAGNPMSPNLHDVTLSIENGYFINEEGAHVGSMKIPTITAEQVFSYGSDAPGDIIIHISLENGVRLASDVHIKIIDTAKVKIIPSAIPQVGGNSVDIFFEITDSNGNILTGFDSVLSIELPAGVGGFSGDTFDIKNGKTEAIRFTPGRIAGENLLALDIPGLGYITDVPFTILPGKPFYINGTTTEANMEFSLRDRYGNLTPVNMPATMKRNSDSPQESPFLSGKIVLPKSPGYWRVDAPTLSGTVLTYTDEVGLHTINGIPFYVMYVAEEVGRYEFLPDYNARYTVLAGDSFLREGEDILYNTTPGESQSLAVSTVLTSPYEQSSIFSIFPGGGYSVSQSADTAVESSITLENGNIILSAYDAVSRARIARVAYPVRNSQIGFSLPNTTEYTQRQDGDDISLMRNTITKISYTKNQGFTLTPGIKLTPIPTKSSGYLTLSIIDNGNSVGEMTIITDSKVGVDVAANLSNISNLTLDSTHSFTRIDVYSKSFDAHTRGYSIVKKISKSILEERMIGQNGIDSLGSLSEVPGVGWHDNNRSLLSFAAGDTVGEATRWSHSYTFINLGDPVAHVDEHAPSTELEGIDRTIGTQISGGVHGGVKSFSHRDMNGDVNDDIIIVYDDGFLELLQNINGKFHRKQMIAYLPNIGDREIEFGDFTGDRYADILGVDKEGKLVLVENNMRRLTSREINIEGSLAPPSGVTQLKVYDMDADGKDDIVYLTEGGELAILYGTATSGTFIKKILESNLGIRLSGANDTSGGAIRATTTPLVFPVNVPTTSTGADEGVLNDEVFYLRSGVASHDAPATITTRDPVEVEMTLATSLTDPNLIPIIPPVSSSQDGDLYVRSEYAPAYGLEIERNYKNNSSDVIHSGDKILSTITIKNTSSRIAKNVEYLDTIPKIFDASETMRYTITTLDGVKKEKNFQYLPTEEFDAYFNLGDIPVGATITLTYELRAFPASYGTMIVDNLEKGLAGDDSYGDVGFETSNTCGADIVLWSSTEVRSYIRGTRSFGVADLPPSLAGKFADVNPKNGIPDSVENMNTGALNDAYKDMGDGTSLTQNTPLFSSSYDPEGRLFSLDFSSSATQDIESIVQNLANGLACGFGGGSCMSFPINYAFNMPGSSISVLGTPVLPLTPVTGIGPVIPVFSFPTYCSPYSPPMWPPCPINAGGTLPGVATGFRVFAGMTMTLAAVGAVCYSSNVGPAAMNYLFPLNPLGNCIGTAVPLPVCKGDGSEDDGSVAAISGLGTSTDAWNGASCDLKAHTFTSTQTESLRQDIVSYLRNPNSTRLNNVYSGLTNRGGRSLSFGPLLTLGNGGSDGTVIEFGLDMSKPFSLGNIIKVKNRRIAGFPEFIMDWVARQTDEITNKLLTPPNLVIVPPRTFGQNATLDGSFADFLNKFSKDRIKAGYEEFKNKVAGAGNVDVTSSFNKRTTGNTSASKGYNDWLDKKVTENSSNINRIAGGANQMKAAYQFIGQLPFIRIEQDTIPISIPWILPQELDRYSRAMDSYTSTIENAKKGWCIGKTPAECADQHTNLGLGALSASIEANLKRIEEYKRFPEKIQKYLTWKERYIAQLLCNVDSLEQILGGWYRDNGIRFRKWAEFYVLLKAIVSSWQPLLDIFKIKDDECAVCRNERWDLKDFIFKVLSAVIPQLPILQFPKWPDIVLDLSDIRLGIAIKVPNFRFDINPIRLPDLPSLSLPDLPSLSLNLPGIPTLPPIPPLPDLPDLPSLPKIALPSLPPPPKLPKIFGAVSATLNILKLFAKIYCFYQKTPLIPEAELGTVLAQRTDRQTTLSFDFLKIKFPQFAIPSIKEIKVSTHTNLELRSDFIATFARNAVKPINSFGADFKRIGPKKIGPDINIQIPKNIDLTPRSSLDSIDSSKTISLLENALSQSMKNLENEQNTLLDLEEFVPYFQSQLALAGQDSGKIADILAKSRYESNIFTKNIQSENKKGFSLLRDYLQSEQAENKKLQRTLDTIENKTPTLLSDSSLPRALFIARDESLSVKSLSQYNEWYDSQRQSDINPVHDRDSERLVASLGGQISRLMAKNSDPLSASSPNTAAGYSPIYEGIYILTPVGKIQTRLFDYTDLVGPEDKVQVADIDKDGDADYMFLLGGKLYIKYSHLNTPERSNDTTSKRENIEPSLVPVAPNFFDESISSPGKVEVSFTPSNPNDSSFRLEFFDRYMQWDQVTIDGRDSRDVPRTVIDLTTTQGVVHQDGMEVTPVERYLRSVSNPSDFILEGQKVSILSEGQTFTLSAGRALYTGTKSASIQYSSGSAFIDMTLAPSRRYVFSFALSGSIKSEKVYILNPSGTEKLGYSSDMLGMPLLPEAHIQSAGGVDIYDPIHKDLVNIPAGSTYRQISLGAKSDTYTISFSYPNGFYSARLHTPSGELVRAGVTLISPQASLDNSPPVVDLSEKTRLPVYQSKTIKLSDFITEMSTYTVTIDSDITVDSNHDGIYDNDFATIGTGFTLSNNNTLILGSFDTLGSRFMNMQVVDLYGNITLVPLQIDVYSPIPQIQSVSKNGMLTGALDAPLSFEPIHFFRIRESEGLKKLFEEKTNTNIDGIFNTGSIFIGSGATFVYSGGTLKIDESTGLPSTNFLVTQFLPATSTDSMRIVFSKSEKNLFTENIIPSKNIRLSTSSIGFDALPIPSLMIVPEVGYSLVSASLSDPSIPGGIYLIDSNHRPILSIDIRGQIYTTDSSILFDISPGKYLTLLPKKGVTKIATLTYKTNFFYTVK